jgi:type II secretory pathway pseudopilin PulG
MKKLPAISCQLSVQQGFTYLGLLFFIAILGATLALAGVVWHTAQQREKERELLFVGQQFRLAIGTYFNRSTGTVKQFPKTLEELLKDPRQLTSQRYLRRIYRDPITRQTEWGLVKSRDDRIIGVYSLSDDEPIKQGNFREVDKDLAGKAHYSDWRFVYSPAEATPQSIAAPPNPSLAPESPLKEPPVPAKPPLNLLTLPPANQTHAESLCDTLLSNDSTVCQAIALQHGEENGNRCQASAQERYAQCSQNHSTLGLPELNIEIMQKGQDNPVGQNNQEPNNPVSTEP